MVDLEGAERARSVTVRIAVGIMLIAGGVLLFVLSPGSRPELSPPGTTSEIVSALPNASPTDAISRPKPPPSAAPTPARTVTEFGISLQRLSESDKALLQSAGLRVYRNSGALVVSPGDTNFKAGDYLLGECGEREVDVFDVLVTRTRSLAADSASCFRILRPAAGDRPVAILEVGVGL